MQGGVGEGIGRGKAGIGDGSLKLEHVIFSHRCSHILTVLFMLLHRLLIPTTGGSSPAGWAALPVFEKTGPFVASGTYHLPLFQVWACIDLGQIWVYI